MRGTVEPAGWAGMAASRRGSKEGRTFRHGCALRSHELNSSQPGLRRCTVSSHTHSLLAAASLQVVAALEAGRAQPLVPGTLIQAGFWSIAVPPAISEISEIGAEDEMLYQDVATVSVISNSGERERD